MSIATSLLWRSSARHDDSHRSASREMPLGPGKPEEAGQSKTAPATELHIRSRREGSPRVSSDFPGARRAKVREGRLSFEGVVSTGLRRPSQTSDP